MTSFWEDKYHSTERSIVFLQATHAEILKGLHDEIELLQKQCSGTRIIMPKLKTTYDIYISRLNNKIL